MSNEKTIKEVYAELSDCQRANGEMALLWCEQQERITTLENALREIAERVNKTHVFQAYTQEEAVAYRAGYGDALDKAAAIAAKALGEEKA